MRSTMSPQLYMGKGKPEQEKMEPIRDRPHWNKAAGGLWTSSYRPETKDSDWIEWCRSEMPDWLSDERWVLYPHEDARILRIDTLADFQKMYERYGTKNATFSMGEILFESMSEQFDGMHLTERGQAETRFSQPGLYGWDCESTLWFRWVFSETHHINLPKRLISLEE